MKKNLVCLFLTFIFIISTVPSVSAKVADKNDKNETNYSISINGVTYNVNVEYDINGRKITTVDGGESSVTLIRDGGNVMFTDQENSSSTTLLETEDNLMPLAAASCGGPTQHSASYGGYQYSYVSTAYYKWRCQRGTATYDTAYSPEFYLCSDFGYQVRRMRDAEADAAYWSGVLYTTISIAEIYASAGISLYVATAKTIRDALVVEAVAYLAGQATTSIKQQICNWLVNSTDIIDDAVIHANSDWNQLLD